jgi:L-2-hydroxyglutarate oxidase LhgO
LAPEFAGIRPKLQGPGEAFRDFVITHEEKVGFPGLVNLIGIESPGLTASLAIARYVGKMMKELFA